MDDDRPFHGDGHSHGRMLVHTFRMRFYAKSMRCLAVARYLAPRLSPAWDACETLLIGTRRKIIAEADAFRRESEAYEVMDREGGFAMPSGRSN